MAEISKKVGRYLEGQPLTFLREPAKEGDESKYRTSESEPTMLGDGWYNKSAQVNGKLMKLATNINLKEGRAVKCVMQWDTRAFFTKDSIPPKPPGTGWFLLICANGGDHYVHRDAASIMTDEHGLFTSQGHKEDGLWAGLRKYQGRTYPSQWHGSPYGVGVWSRFRVAGKPVNFMEVPPLLPDGSESAEFFVAQSGDTYHIYGEKPKWSNSQKIWHGNSQSSMCREGWESCAKVSLHKNHLYRLKLVVVEGEDGEPPVKKEEGQPKAKTLAEKKETIAA